MSTTDAFRPRRRPNRNYRPLTARGAKRSGPKDPLTDDSMGKQLATLGNHVDGRDSLERDFGPEIADALRDRARAKRLGSELSVDEYLQMADYMTSEPGTLEEKQGERRALALDAWDEEDRRVFVESLDELIEAARVEDLGLGDLEYEEEDEGASTKNAAMARIDEEIEEMEEEVDEEGELIDPLQLAHGEWYVNSK